MRLYILKSIFIAVFILGTFSISACKSRLYIWVDGRIDSANQQVSNATVNASSHVLQPLDSKHYPLVAAYPELANDLKRVPLCDCPTPVESLAQLERRLGGSEPQISIYVKRDGLSNRSIYGGNKVRKLELLLAQALQSGRKSILINGTVGSNSALATMLYAKHLGLIPEVHMAPQIPSDRVTRNLTAFSRALALPMNNVLAQAEPDLPPSGSLQYHRSLMSTFTGLSWASMSASSDDKPFITPPGATSILSTIAYVNAAYELAADIEAGRMPTAPSRIYVPAGSGGTFIGLLIGMKAIPVLKNTQLVAVSSGSKRPTAQYVNHFREVVNYLDDLSNGTFPALVIDETEMDIILNRDYTGGQYGKITPKATAAKGLAQADGLHLEHSYTAKTMAKLIDDYQSLPSDAPAENWLYWHTHSDVTPLYKRLIDPEVDEASLKRLQQVFSKKDLKRYGLTPPIVSP